MAHGFTVQGGLGAGGSVIPHESPAHSVLVPDTELLFTAQFHRAGPDLVLTGRDGQHHLIPGYFSSEHHPALVAPNGAHLSPDTVDLLAGSAMPGHYAQAQPTAPPDAIGKIEKVVGDVSVVRNGVAVELHVGDAVFKSDVVQTGASASCGISFPDGTALNLVANTRMALNDYAFDASSSSNGALFTLVEGTFAFVAGKVAHTGDMKIATPVATMGIRGTTGVVEEQPPTTVTASAKDHTYIFAVVPDFGTGIAGMWDMYLTDANGDIVRDANGNPIILDVVSKAGYVTYVTPQGLGQPPLVETLPVTDAQFAFQTRILRDLADTLNLGNPNNNGNNGSSTPPPQESPNASPQLQEAPPTPIKINDVNGNSTGSSGSSGSSHDTIIPPPPPPIIPPSNVAIWTSSSSDDWATAVDWNINSVPGAPKFVEILSQVTVTISAPESASGLELAAAAVLIIIAGGSLTISSVIDNAGLIELSSLNSVPTLAIDGTVFLQGGGQIEMLGPATDNMIVGIPNTGATLINVDNTISGSGTIGGDLTLKNFGIINATGEIVVNTGNEVINGGLLEATSGGTLVLDDNVANSGGTIAASGNGSLVEINAVTISGGFLETDSGGSIQVIGGASIFDDLTITSGSEVQVTDGSSLTLEGTIDSSGVLTIMDGANLFLVGATVTGGTITDDGAIHVTANSTIDGNAVVDGDIGVLTVNGGVTLTLDDATLENLDVTNGGTLRVNGSVTLSGVTVSGHTIDDTGTLLVSASSEIENATINGGGDITVTSGILTLDAVTLDNVTVSGSVSNASTLTIDDTVTLNGATINGHTIDDTGTLLVSASSEIENATVNGGGDITVIGGQILTLDAVTLDDITVSGSVSNASTLTIDDTVTLNGATINGQGHTIDDTGTLSVSASSEIENATINGGGDITVIGGQILTLDAVTLDNVTVSGSVSNASTLTIDDTVTLSGATINHGTIDDTGNLSVSASSEIENATVNGGGDITVIGGQILTLDAVTLDNVTVSGSVSNASTLTIDDTVTLSGATINHGTIDDTGTLLVSASSEIENATVNGGGDITVIGGQILTLDAVTLDDITVSGSVSNASTLTIDDTVTLSGATINHGTIDDTGTLLVSVSSEIENATINGGGDITVTGGQILTLDAVTLDNVTVSGSVSNASTLTIDDTVTLNGATINGQGHTIDDTGTLSVSASSEIENATVNGGGDITVIGGILTLDAVTLDNITVSGSVSNASTLTIDDTVTLNGATINGQGHTIDDTGTLSVSASSEIENATVNGGGDITVIGGILTLDAVTLDNITVSGSVSNASTLTIDDTVTLNGATINGHTIDDTGTLLVSASSEIENATVNGGGDITVIGGQILTLDAVTLDDITVSGSVSNASTLTIDDTVTLSSATINGQGHTIDDTGTLSVSASSEIENATINGGGDITVTSGILTLDAVTLDNVTVSGSVSNASTLTIDDTVTLNGATINGHTIDDTGTLLVSASSEIENATVNGGGDITVIGGQILTLDAVTLDDITVSGSVSNASTLTIDDTVTLNGATINGQGHTIDDTGTLSVSASSEIENATINGGGDITVIGGQILTLDAVTLDNVTVSGSVSNASTLTIDDTVTLSSATINGQGHTIDDTGTLSVIASSEIENATINGGGDITVTSGILTLDAVTLDNITVSGSVSNASTLTIDDTVTLNGATINGQGHTIDDTGTLLVIASSEIENATINGGGDITVTSGILTLDNMTLDGVTLSGNITIDHTVTLDGATINHGTIDDTGTLLVSVSSEIENATINGGGDITVTGGQILTLDAVTLDNVTVSGSVSNASTLTIDDTVTLNGATINGQGHTVDDTGTLLVSASSEIENATINGGGDITVIGGQILTLDAVTLDNVTVSGSVSNASTLTIDDTVTLNGATINGQGHTIDDTGTLSVSASSEIENATVNGGGDITVTSGILTLDAVTLDNVTVSGSVSNASTLTIDDTVTLSGATINGHTIDDTGNLLVSASSEIDGTEISGAGTMTIDAGSTLDVVNGTTTIDVSGTITNAGVLEASSGGTLIIESNINNASGQFYVTSGGTLEIGSELPISGGSATIQGGTLHFDEGSNVNVTFDNSNGYGKLIVGDSDGDVGQDGFEGKIFGFSGTAPDAAHSDVVELDEFAVTDYSVQFQNGNEILTLDDNGIFNTLTFEHFNGTLVVTSSGGKTFIYDPPAVDSKAVISPVAADESNQSPPPPSSQGTVGADHTFVPSLTNSAVNGSSLLSAASTNAGQETLASASLGGLGNDSFTFHPNLGSDTAQNTDAHASELAHSNIQVGAPALASIAPEFHQEFAFDAIHQDAANHAATVDQFHQMAANSTLLH